jgi:hypothetical protein
MDVRMYPQGRGQTVDRYINGVEVVFGIPQSSRVRVTLAQLNAGFNVLPALPGVRWRLLYAMMIAIGGAATTGTSVNLIGTAAAAAVQLMVVTVAALTRSTLIQSGVTPAAGSVTMLADGASLGSVANDPNTAISVITVGSAMTVMTNLDVFLDYVADPQ